MILLLNGAAREEAGRNKKKLTEQQYTYLTDKNRPYCCLITGYQSTTIAEHPTHGYHTTFAKKGKTPENVSKPKIWNIVTIPFATNSISNVEQNNDSNGNNIIHTETGRFDLNKEGADEGSLCEDEGSNEPTPNPDPNLLEAIFHNGCSDLEPSALIPDGWSPADPLAPELAAEIRGVLRDLISMNCTKKEAIKLVFGASKGGGAKYKAASYWYEEVKAQIK
ncbi:MAG: hypothetical protein F6K08_15915 [Okeania sp. SIO1H6]|nr:hypothetical protein [Okeania sp. SIO1H6]